MRVGILPGALGALALHILLQPSWSELCRQSLLSILSWSSLPALDVEGGLQFSHVHVPWSEACSGLNTLAVMMGLAVWSTLPAAAGSFARRLALAVAIAFAVNVGRAVTISAGRLALAPAWEGETAHFFVGFLWIVLGVSLFARIVRLHAAVDGPRWVHAACVLAVASVVSSWPSGTLAAASALVCLFAIAPSGQDRYRALALLTWMTIGVAIAWSQMESLWLPWLLTCPHFGGSRLLHSVPGCVTLVGTIPVVSMQPLWLLIALPMMAVMIIRLVRADTWGRSPVLPLASTGGFRWAPALASAGVPFLLPSLIAPEVNPIRPSPALMPRPVSDSAFLVRAPGQAADIAALWVTGRGGGRHHSVESCFALRQVSTRRVGGVLQRGDVWVAEFFLHEGELHSSYASYLLSSLAPWSSTGVHLVLQSPIDSMDAAYFSIESERTAQVIQSSIAETPRAASDPA